MNVTLYKTQNCPRCAQVKKWLDDNKNTLPAFNYDEVYLDDAEGLTEARIRGVFVKEAPALSVGMILYTANVMFKNNNLKEKDLRQWIEGS